MAKKKRAAKRAGLGWDAQRFKGMVIVFTGSFPSAARRGTLIYSCRLAKDGTFACCTQNLNPCGGLRGKLCKHLLVLVIGLTRGEQLDATTVDEWVEASRISKPDLDKDIMSETLLRYKGAQAGEDDWRSTETVPEDYYAF